MGHQSYKESAAAGIGHKRPAHNTVKKVQQSLHAHKVGKMPWMINNSFFFLEEFDTSISPARVNSRNSYMIHLENQTIYQKAAWLPAETRWFLG